MSENDDVLPYMEIFDTVSGLVVDHWNINVIGCSASTTIGLNGPQGVAFTPNDPRGNFFCVLDDTPLSTPATLYVGTDFPIGNNNTNQWGSSPFNAPKGLATDGTYLYVADTGNGFVDEFDPNATCPFLINPIHRWKGFAPYNFIKPTVVACDSARNVYVADVGYSPSLIQEYSSGGVTFLGQWYTVPGCVVNGMAVDGSGNVYISDKGNGLVEEYDPTGNLLRSWGDPHGPHEFQAFLPSCIALDTVNNQIIVGDAINETIEVFGP